MSEDQTVFQIILLFVGISSTVIIAYLFKYTWRPKIEKIYEYNRDLRIGAIISIIELSDWNMEDIFKILEQNNCVGDEFSFVNLSDSVTQKIGESLGRLDKAYSDVYKRVEEAKQYVFGDELLPFLDFINNSRAFAEELHEKKYNPQYLKRRGKFAKILIDRYKSYFTDDFVKKWENIRDYRLE